MKTVYIALLSGVLAIASAVVNAQEPTRVRGTIAAIDGDVLSVKSSSGNDAAIHLSDKTVIVFSQPIALADIKPGEYVWLNAEVGGDGKLTTAARIQVSRDGVKPPQ